MSWIDDNFKKPVPKPKGWVTINEIASKTGSNRKTVACKIRSMLDAGEIISMDCFENGKRCKCYKQNDKKRS